MSITAEIAATIAANDIRESKVKDKYGRSVSEFSIFDRETKTHSIVVLCTLPKVAREADPTKQYIVNNWSKRHYEETSHWYFASRNEAKKFALEELVASQSKKLEAAKIAV